jgi:protein translocase SEC61 complex gamma subunit
LALKDFIDSARRLFSIATRPSRDEIWLLVKISILGVVIVGAIGYAVRILFFFVGLLPQGP